MIEKKELFGVDIKSINFIYLSDNEWYDINGTLQITEQFFSAWCLRVKADKLGRQASLRVVGNISQILLAEAEYS